MNIVIVGAGVAGLTLGYLLANKGFKVTILEKEERVGGLARSFHYNNWSIDIGPHRFHTDDKEVEAFIFEIMGESLINIPRKSKVFFCDKHFDWPLTFKSIVKLPPSMIMKSFGDVIFRPKTVDDSFESYVLRRYGKTITNSFFREYTQKFLKLDLKHCHMDWAETGINRATIDSDIRSSSIVDLLFGLLSNKKVNTRFLYPKDGAIDIFSTLLAERIRQTGGQIEVGVRIDKALIRDRKVRSLMDADGRQYDLDFLFWSGSALDLERMLCCEKSGLNYCCTLLCNMLIEGRPAVPVQWEYFGSRELIFSRVSINTSFNPCLALEGYYGVCVEIVCYENDYIWANGEKLLNIIIHNLIKTNIVSNFNSVVDVHFEKVKNTYPIYKLDYLEELKTYQKKIAQFKNVLAFGRTGGFWYNNMDHSIRSSIDLAKTVSREDLEDKINSPAGVFRGDF